MKPGQPALCGAALPDFFMDWQDLMAALALVLVIEGLIPFFSPNGYKSMVVQMAAMPENTLRIVGLVLMIIGLGLLVMIRS